MTITTKFNIHDLAQYKYSSPEPTDKIALCYEVQNIDTNTCIGGVQVFYLCRAIHTVVEHSFKQIQEILDITPGFSRESHNLVRFREDELIPASEQVMTAMKKFSNQ